MSKGNLHHVGGWVEKSEPVQTSPRMIKDFVDARIYRVEEGDESTYLDCRLLDNTAMTIRFDHGSGNVYIDAAPRSTTRAYQCPVDTEGHISRDMDDDGDY